MAPSTRTGSSSCPRTCRACRLASSADAAFVEVPGVLALDVDTPDDLLLAEAEVAAHGRDGVGVGD